MRSPIRFAFALALVMGPIAAQSSPAPASATNGPFPLAAPAPGGAEGTQPIPEPSTLLLVGTGLLGVALTARLRKRRAAN